MNVFQGVKFESTTDEAMLLDQIIARIKREHVLSQILAVQLGRRGKSGLMDTRMDLIACHSNGCPLDYAKLLEFDLFNLAHDILGIGRHLNRITGQLENCFVPRCAK